MESVTADGKEIFTANSNSNEITVFDRKGKYTRTMVCPAADGIEVNIRTLCKQGHLLYIPDATSQRVLIVDKIHNVVYANIPTNQFDVEDTNGATKPNFPAYVDVNHSYLVVLGGDSDFVSIFNLTPTGAQYNDWFMAGQNRGEVVGMVICNDKVYIGNNKHKHVKVYSMRGVEMQTILLTPGNNSKNNSINDTYIITAMTSGDGYVFVSFRHSIFALGQNFNEDTGGGVIVIR